MAESEKELPEAFGEEAQAPAVSEVYDNDPTRERDATSTGLDRVEEGSEESFPGSDVPSTSPPTKLADHPADPS